MGKLLGELTVKEFDEAVRNINEYIGMWIDKHNIRAGSHLGSPVNKCNPYSIYKAVEDALRQEYHKAKPTV